MICTHRIVLPTLISPFTVSSIGIGITSKRPSTLVSKERAPARSPTRLYGGSPAPVLRRLTAVYVRETRAATVCEEEEELEDRLREQRGALDREIATLRDALQQHKGGRALRGDSGAGRPNASTPVIGRCYGFRNPRAWC